MSRGIARIDDWESLANESRYSPVALAKARKVSLRQLERDFQKQFGKTPYDLLHELRMRRALELLKDGTAVKEVAFLLGYKDAAYFSHEFKRYYGIAPSAASSQSVAISQLDQLSRFHPRCRDSTCEASSPE